MSMAILCSQKRKPPKFYVNASTGSNSNNGLSRAAAVASIAKVDTLTPGPVAGDIISVAPGTYDDTGGSLTVGIFLTKGGSAGNLVTYLCEQRWSAKIVSSQAATNTSEGAQIQIGNSSFNAGFIKLKNFELDYSTATRGDYYHWGIECGGSGCVFEALWFHDYCNTTTKWNQQLALNAPNPFGGYIHPDSWWRIVDGTTIKECIFENFGGKDNRNQHTGHGIYIDGQSNAGAGTHGITNTTVTNCLFNNLAGQNLTSFNNITSITSQNNTFYNCGNYTTPIGDGFGEAVVLDNTGTGTINQFSNCIVRNNVFHSTGRCIEENEPTAGTGNIYTFNVFFNASTAVSLKGPNAPTQNNNVTTDPDFVNSAGGNFHFDVGTSSAKNTGTPTGAPYYDLDYNVRSATAPSRGCYEI